MNADTLAKIEARCNAYAAAAAKADAADASIGDSMRADYARIDIERNATTDVPALIAEVRRLRAALDAIADCERHGWDGCNCDIATAVLEGKTWTP